jgi:nucleoid DNA-binding protein
MHWKSQKGKSGLIHMLMKEHGLSKRKAEKAVNAVFSCWTRALKHGDCIEIPGGLLSIATRHPNRKRRQFQKFRNIKTRKVFYRLLDYPKKEIRFRPDPALIEPPRKPKHQPKPGTKPQKKAKTPALPRPKTQPLTMADQLTEAFQRLGIEDLDQAQFQTLVAFCQQDPHRLLACLQSFADEGRHFATPQHLIATMGRRKQISRSR